MYITVNPDGTVRAYNDLDEFNIGNMIAHGYTILRITTPDVRVNAKIVEVMEDGSAQEIHAET